MAEPGRGPRRTRRPGAGPAGAGPAGAGPAGGGTAAESIELRRLRRRIDALDRRIVRLLNERTELGREVGRAKRREGRRAVRDLEREREVLLRVAMANVGPLRQADLLAIYRRLIAATRAVESADGTAERGSAKVRHARSAPAPRPDDGGR